MATSKISPEILQNLSERLSWRARVLPIPDSDAEVFDAAFSSWSDYNKDVPSAVIKIHTVGDALETVLWATLNSIPFAVRAGGHSNFCTTGEGGVIIDLSNLNKITVHEESVTVQTGVLTGDLVEAVYSQGRCVVSGSCNKVGISGSSLAGGFGPLNGLHGLISDNLLSARVVTAAGEVVEVSKKKNPELFWALRGAGMKFGLVVELTFRTYPLSTLGSDDGTVWERSLMWGEEHLEELVGRLHELDYKKGEAAVYFGFMSMQQGSKVVPLCMTLLHYFGSDSDAEAHFKSLLSLTPLHPLGPPLEVQQARVPYNQINAIQNPSQLAGGYKTMFGTGIQKLCPRGIRTIWGEYVGFVTAHPDAFRSVVLMQLFSMEKIREMGRTDDTAYSHRNVNMWAFPLLWYDYAHTESAAVRFGETVRKTLQHEDFGGAGKVKAYLSFSRGDESIVDTYGSEERVKRLEALKNEWDPEYIFGGLVPRLKKDMACEAQA